MDLSERRASIDAEHKAQEKYDPHWSAEARAGRAISARPVAFVCDDEVVVLADDLDAVRAGVEKFFEQISADGDALSSRLATEPSFAQCVEKCHRLLGAERGDGRFLGQEWNAINRALNEAGVDVVLADGKVAVAVSLLSWLKAEKLRSAGDD